MDNNSNNNIAQTKTPCNICTQHNSKTLDYIPGMDVKMRPTRTQRAKTSETVELSGKQSISNLRFRPCTYLSENYRKVHPGLPKLGIGPVAYLTGTTDCCGREK